METIKVLFSDIDGTLTDGSIHYGVSESGEKWELISFNVKDGMGIVRWRKSGKLFGVLSGRDVAPMYLRLDDLAIEHRGLKIDNKKEWLQNWLAANGYSWQQLAFIGDDINDIDVMQMAGHCACPQDALPLVKAQTKYVCQREGGRGAVREYIDLLMAAP